MRFLLTLLLSLGLLACEPAPAVRHAHGAFGVFFGGQVQERAEIQVARSRRPILGFRVEFPASGSGGHELEYEIIRPGPGSRRLSEQGKASVPAERLYFDQRIELGPDLAYGTWNLRVICDGFAVIDRALLVQPET